MRKMLAIGAALVAVALWAAPASGEGNIKVSESSGPRGTVVTFTGASDLVAPDLHPCHAPVTLVLQPSPPPIPPIDMTGGEPFTPPNGTFTVPQTAPGEYRVAVVCHEPNGPMGTDAFSFTVTSSPVAAQPNLAG